MTVTVNSVQVEFHTNPPKVTFLQGASMVIDDIRDNLRAIEESVEGRLSPFKQIIKASGNEDFTTDGSVKSALTIVVQSPFVMAFEAGALPFQTSFGNLLGTFVESPGAIVQINNAVSATTVTVATGSGLDTGQDSKLTAIDAKVAQLVFTNPNQLDVNTKSMNDAAVQGDGSAGDPWRGTGVSP